MPAIATNRNIFLSLGTDPVWAEKALHQDMTSSPNSPTWIHLSNHILLYQLALGNVEPGRVNNTAETINKPMAQANKNRFDLKLAISAIKLKGTPEEAPYNQL